MDGCPTVDGSEILRSPFEVTVVYPIIYRVLHIQGGAGFLPSTVGLVRINGLFHLLINQVY